ncbi:MAG: recombination protein RecR [Dehalococcoidia bacterium]|nr:recombination protein RecR [Dehalococcoidia bacterium]
MPDAGAPEPITRLIQEFSKLPGIGPKSAQRLSYHVLGAPEEDARALAKALQDVKETVVLCSICFNITVNNPCLLCGDEERDRSLVCVVEQPLDVLVVERTGGFRGLYHVLHGALNPIEGVGPEKLRIQELLGRAEAGGLKEVIMATNPSLEGEATSMYLQRLLQPLGVRVTRLARGLPSGADIEYLDDLTLSRALEGRQEL